MRRWILLMVLLLPFLATANDHLSSSEGFYTLVGGTQGCPQEVQWDNQCHGFTLSPSNEGKPLETVHFCRINRGPHLRTEDHKKIFSQTVRQGSVFKAKEIVSYPSARGTVTMTAEDSVMIDHEGRLLWDHNRDEQGLSCLYSHQM